MRKKAELGLHEPSSQPTSDEVMRWIGHATIGSPADEAVEDMRAIADRYAHEMAEAFSKMTQNAGAASV
jgi:hypothetical protein